MIRRGRGKGGLSLSNARKVPRLDERKKPVGLDPGRKGLTNGVINWDGCRDDRQAIEKVPLWTYQVILPHKKRPTLIAQNEFLDSLACDFAVWRALAVPGWAPAEPI
jgi:hypothetical protein